METLNVQQRNDLASVAAVTEAERQTLASNARVKHIQSDDVYVKAYSVPPGIKLYNKTFSTDHVTILAQGEVVIEIDNDRVKFTAPAHYIFKANKRYAVYTMSNCVWYCIHPTDETDLEKLKEKY